MAERRGDDAPLDAAGLARRLLPLLPDTATGLVAAVSGGPDSIALLHLLAALAANGRLPPLAVATVDHGLRPGSAADAAFVVAEARAAGLAAHLLTWADPKPARAVQERARDARYRLLAGLCRGIGADHLVTAHTRDDQAETMLMRLARGSGPAGLAAMRPVSRLADGVTLLRPLLDVPKGRLVAAGVAAGWRSLRDPANEDPRHERTRLRRLMPTLAASGLTAAALARAAGRIGRAEAALDAAVAAQAEVVVAGPGGHERHLAMAPLASLPVEFTLRLIAAALGDLGAPRPLRLDRLETAVAALRTAAARRTALRRTLHGCRLVLDEGGSLAITPEGPRRRARPASAQAEGDCHPGLR